MGLIVVGSSTEKRYSYGYSQLHVIRWLACKSRGYEKDFVEFMKDQKNNIWEKYPDFRQLLHFSDSEGILIREDFLYKIDYQDSFELGSSTKLLEELEIIKDELARNPDIFQDASTKPFFSLYDVVKNDVEEGRGILWFC